MRIITSLGWFGVYIRVIKIKLRRWLGIGKKKCPVCGMINNPIPYREQDRINGKIFSCYPGFQRDTCPYCLAVIKWKILRG